MLLRISFSGHQLGNGDFRIGNHHYLVETKTVFHIVYYLILNFYLGGVNKANVMNNQNICHRDDKITSV